MTGIAGDPSGTTLSNRTTRELLGLSRAILRELKVRGVVRTGNAPTGDYAELLVRQATGGELAPNSERSWDVLLPDRDGTRLQVKARVVTGKGRGERQLSVFRSWEFDAAIIILFDDEFVVRRAARLPVDVLREIATYVGHVNGWRVMATDDVLDRGEDWTSLVREVVM